MNKFTSFIAKQFNDVIFGKNWTAVDLKSTISDVSWEEAITQVYGLNTIATLVFHINYYVKGVSEFLQGKDLEIKDKFSFAHPPINSAQDWEAFLESVWKDTMLFSKLIGKLSDDQMDEEFADYKYGNYYRNLSGIIEHAHYHLGQIVILKKIIRRL